VSFLVNTINNKSKTATAKIQIKSEISQYFEVRSTLTIFIFSFSLPKEFTRTDNVYKGKLVSFSKEYKSLGELIWKSMEKYENNIANVG
jgi:hypothetical protein